MGIFADAIRSLTGSQIVTGRKNTAANLRVVYGSVADAVSFLEGRDQGASIRTGSGMPAAGLGSGGDAYIDVDTSDFYQKSSVATGSGSGWFLKLRLRGAAGNRYLTDVVQPTASTIGKVGDIFYYIPSNNVYYIYDYPAVVATGVNPWQVRFSSGAAGGLFLNNIAVSLSGGKTLGKFRNGDQIPSAGLTPEAVMRLIAIESLYPSYAIASIAISQSASADGEVGERLTNTISASFASGDAGAISQLRIQADGLLLGTAGSSNNLSHPDAMARTLNGRLYQAFANYGAGQPKLVTPGNTPDERTPAIRNGSAPQAAESGFATSQLLIAGHYRLFFGPQGADSTLASAQVRALSGSQLTSAGNGGILNTGTSATHFLIVLPPARTLTNVTDLDNVMANVTSAYQAQATISVNDAGGNPIPGYTPYLYAAAGAYGSSARHQFTYA